MIMSSVVFNFLNFVTYFGDFISGDFAFILLEEEEVRKYEVVLR